LTRLYRPDQGRILLDGSDLQAWEEDALRRRIGVIFQDYIRYQFSVGENIGVGDTLAFDDQQRWQEAAAEGMAAPFIERLIAAMPRNWGAGLPVARSCPAGSGRRSRCPARTCVAMPIS
jgi:ABC-type multidrug transport system fused ATPase/permease subunit